MEMTPRVLLIDDDPDDRFLVGRALRGAFPGMVLLEAADAKSYAKLKGEAVDLVITDCVLGWTDGWRLAEKLKKERPSLPIIMYSGGESLGTESVSRAIKVPLQAFVEKSHGYDRLIEAVWQALAPKPSSRLSEGDQAFAAVAANIVDYAVFLLDETGRVRTWNPGAEKIKGYKPEEIIGRSFSVFYTPEDLAVARPRVMLETARDTGHAVERGWRVRKDGTRFWADVTLTALRGPNGEVEGFCKITRDLTSTRNAEEQLRLSEERFRLLVSSIEDYAIFMLDVDGRVVTWNVGAEKINGWRAADILGKSITVFYPPEDAEVAHRLLKEAASPGSARDEGWRLRKDGSRFWAEVVLTALRDDGGRLIGFAEITRDLSEKRRSDAELARRSLALEAANRELKLFTSTVSHDLKAPLRSIRGFADLLLKATQDQPETAALARRLAEAAERLDGMVGDLLQYSRLGNESLPLAETSVMGAFDRAAKDLASDLSQRGAKLTFKGDRPPVLAHPGTLDRIAANLLSNALKFTPEGKAPDIDVECTAPVNGRVRVLVSDRGIGVTDSMRTRLFQPFQREHPRDLYPGHGLGLAIIRRAAALMGGEVGYVPREGGGSVFWLELNAAKPA